MNKAPRVNGALFILQISQQKHISDILHSNPQKEKSRSMIEFKNVYKTYPNGFTALKNINLQIEQGEFVAIIGLSGAGKSTILR